MGEHTYRVFIDELTAVCIVCAKCGTKIELGIDKFDTIFKCPSCGADFVCSHDKKDIDAGNSVAFSQLEDAIKRVQGMGHLFKLSFRIDAATHDDHKQ